jgi:hypothetical protein
MKRWNKARYGYADLADVTTRPKKQSDHCPGYWWSEQMKYYYLIFSDTPRVDYRKLYLSMAIVAAVSVIRVFIVGPSQLSRCPTANRERNGSHILTRPILFPSVTAAPGLVVEKARRLAPRGGYFSARTAASVLATCWLKSRSSWTITILPLRSIT